MNKHNLYLREELEKAWQGQDPFVRVRAVEGEVVRALENRRTFRFRLGDRSYFAKLHHGVRLREVFKNLLQFRLPVVSARNEWVALNRLQELGVETLTPAGYGRRGVLPGSIESFLITDDVGNPQTLEDICADWLVKPPGFGFKQTIVEKVAAISQTLHEQGICHRDFYICHFLLLEHQPLRLCLIDLHRALVKKRLRRRWLIKDIGSLYFSAMDAGLTRRDLLRFMKFYSGKSLRCTLHEDERFWLAVERRATALRQKHA